MIIIIGILIAMASMVTNSVGGIVFGVVLTIIGIVAKKENDPVKIQENENKKKIERVVKVRDNLDNDRFATILRKNITEEEFRYIDESGIISVGDYKNKTGVKVMLDRIETCNQTFYYADYNVTFEKKELEDLAIYLQRVADSYTTKEKEKIHKVRIIKTLVTNSETHYYEDKGGHLQSTYSDGISEYFMGYRVYITGKKVKNTNLKEW